MTLLTFYIQYSAQFTVIAAFFEVRILLSHRWRDSTKTINGTQSYLLRGSSFHSYAPRLETYTYLFLVIAFRSFSAGTLPCVFTRGCSFKKMNFSRSALT